MTLQENIADYFSRCTASTLRPFMRFAVVNAANQNTFAGSHPVKGEAVCPPVAASQPLSPPIPFGGQGRTLAPPYPDGVRPDLFSQSQHEGFDSPKGQHDHVR